jgi:hypothetical protein
VLNLNEFFFIHLIDPASNETVKTCSLFTKE